MLMWSSEIERRVKAKVAAIPKREKLKALVPEKRDVKRTVDPIMVLVATPMVHFQGDTSFAYWCLWGLAAVFVHLSMLDAKIKREQDQLLTQYWDITNRMHDQLLAGRVVALTPTPEGDWRMN